MKQVKPPLFVLAARANGRDVHALGVIFQMAVKHGALVLMPRPCASPGNAQPGLGVGLVRADLRAKFLVENFRAAAGHHDQTDGLEALEHFRC